MKRRETDPASNQFPKCSPPSGTHRNSQSWVEQRGQGGDTGDLVEKKESPKRERAGKPVISLPSGKWVLKIGFLKVKNLLQKKKKTKIKNLEQRLESQKYNIKKKQNKVTKIIIIYIYIYIYIYEVCFKKQGLFSLCKVIVGYKNEN